MLKRWKVSLQSRPEINGKHWKDLLLKQFMKPARDNLPIDKMLSAISFFSSFCFIANRFIFSGILMAFYFLISTEGTQTRIYSHEWDRSRDLRERRVNKHSHWDYDRIVRFLSCVSGQIMLVEKIQNKRLIGLNPICISPVCRDGVVRLRGFVLQDLFMARNWRWKYCVTLFCSAIKLLSSRKTTL